MGKWWVFSVIVIITTWKSESGKQLFQRWHLIIFTLEKAMATHSSTLAWKIPWTEEPGRLQSKGSLRVRHDWATSLSHIGEGSGSPLQCSCLENPRDGGPGGLPSMGSHRVGHDWSDLAASAAAPKQNDDFYSTESTGIFCAFMLSLVIILYLNVLVLHNCFLF